MPHLFIQIELQSFWIWPLLSLFLFSLVDISTFIVFVWSPIEGKERGNLYRGKRWQTFCSIEYKTTFQSQPFHHFLNVSTKASVLIWNYRDLGFGLLLICRIKQVFSRSFGARAVVKIYSSKASVFISTVTNPSNIMKSRFSLISNILVAEAQKPKTFRVETFYAQKLSGRSAQNRFSWQA